jgi:hypothetical protein
MARYEADASGELDLTGWGCLFALLLIAVAMLTFLCGLLLVTYFNSTP